MANVIPSIDIKEIDMSLCFFNPGCAMSIYKPEGTKKMYKLLQEHFGDVKYHNICCHHNPELQPGSTIINNCAGCDRRFRTLYDKVKTISFWEILDSLESVPLPDWAGLKMSVHDSCSFREKPQVHMAVRNILKKMGVELVESEFSGTKSICCGDSLYGTVPNRLVYEAEKRRAEQFPCENVVVYCIGCVRSMREGGKLSRYLPDLIFGEETQPMMASLDEYHRALDAYIGTH